MAIDVPRFRQTSFEESLEGLDAMESGLLDLEIGDPDTEIANAIFRTAHSIRDGSGNFSFDAVTDVTHVLETLRDEMRGTMQSVADATPLPSWEQVDPETCHLQKTANLDSSVPRQDVDSTRPDTTVLERIRDPLVHLVRDAIQRDFDSPSDREPAGKNGISQRGVRTMQVLTFMLDGEEYGVDILHVQEIKGWQDVTPLPNTPAYLRGVITLRGTIVPIIDLRDRFQLEPVEYGPTTVTIFLRVTTKAGRERVIGIVVDAVSDVYDLHPDAVQAAPDFGSGIDIDFVSGLATVDEKMLILIDTAALFEHRELERIEHGTRRKAEAVPA